MTNKEELLKEVKKDGLTTLYDCSYSIQSKNYTNSRIGNNVEHYFVLKSEKRDFLGQKNYYNKNLNLSEFGFAELKKYLTDNGIDIIND